MVVLLSLIIFFTSISSEKYKNIKSFLEEKSSITCEVIYNQLSSFTLFSGILINDDNVIRS